MLDRLATFFELYIYIVAYTTHEMRFSVELYEGHVRYRGNVVLVDYYVAKSYWITGLF